MIAQPPSDENSSAPLKATIPTMLVTLSMTIALACFWVLLVAKPAQ